jgi:hypothetical protein
MLKHSKFYHSGFDRLSSGQLEAVLVWLDFDDTLSVIISEDCQIVTHTDKTGKSQILNISNLN